MSARHLNVVILAAGQGKRMHSELPKVLHRLAGAPLLAHVIARARALNPQRICVVYGHGGEQVSQAFAADDLVFVKQELQFGTAHALAQALPHLAPRGTTLVLYGDVPLVQPATLTALTAHRDGRLVLLTTLMEDPHGYGRIVRDARGNIKSIVEEKDATPKQRAIREVNSGIMALPSAQLADWLGKISNRNAQKEYYLTDIVALALKGKVKIETVMPAACWEIFGVNSKQQLAQVERIYQLREAMRLLDAGVTLADPMRIDVRGELHCGRDVTIDVGCVFEGEVELGSGVEVGAHCVLKDVKVGAGSRIKPFSLIEDAVVGKDCQIGPYARIRPGTELADDVHIGNFVEVKNSHIGDRSKANHLSYIGDASIGRDVNVGAGTITCNYDGANKHRTVIEDDVFIGSDTQLVAPVTVRRGATIGAGSTITGDAPAGELTLSRAAQTTVSGWRRPQKKR
ncbi:MAG TPA: bifunctional UDP-N-acetylglucosamine diphosphorylase/glucosamine-1-phosphate N-acetyltransferase GlmU [Burkholderiales bacterium]|nr:bifunctional UDP-N-acetylglucosamine diphosphorylase/glucosamine-1-phosphate N-acetyltransferase GlmU [Burkholderiales bacterium]